MKKSFQEIILLILFLSSVQLLRAQSKDEKKESEQSNQAQTNNIGFKKQATDPSKVISPTMNQTPTEEKITAQPNQNTQSFPVPESFQFDMNQMPSDVQSKINENKSAGKNLFEGIAKGFSVEIKSCINPDETKKEFLFLENEPGFIKAEFVSSGIIKLIVQPQYDSVALKEKLLAAGINFNFLNEFYFVNN